MIRAAIVLAALAALAGCGRGADNTNAPSPTPNEVAQASPSPAAATCAPAPSLDESQDFSDPRDEFTLDSAAFAKLEANFAEAYRKACADGTLSGHALMPADAPHPGTLFAITAPEANVASIYRAGEESDTPGDMVLEYYFLTPDGLSHVPGVADLHEAIYCAVRGATQQEQDDSGRCLVD